MELETAAARQLEIDFVLEQHGLVTEQRASPGDQLAVPQNGIQSGIERAHILDALHDPSPGLGQAVLVIDHVPSGEFWCPGDLLRPASEVGTLGGVEEAADNEEAGAIEFRQLFGRRPMAHAIRFGSTTISARCASSGKSISIHGRSLMSSKPKSRPPCARTISRIGSSYSRWVRPAST